MSTNASNDRDVLKGSSVFRDMPQRMQGWILESSHASSDFAQFFRNGGTIVTDPETHLPYYHPTEPPKIVVNQASYESLKGPPQSSTILSELAIFTTLAHEIGHDKYNTATMPFRGGRAEDYVAYRADLEARTVFNAFPIFQDLKGNEDFRTINWKFIGYSSGSGIGAAVVYSSWKEGRIEDRDAIAQLSGPIPNFPYTRPDGLKDQDADGLLTQRDLYLRDYQLLIKHRAEPTAPPPPRNPPLTDFANPEHPGHTAFERTLSEVRRMEESHAIPSGPNSLLIAAALLVEAERQKTTIANVRLESDGGVHGIERRNAFEPERRVSVNPQEALQRPMSEYASQWAQLRSPHLTDERPTPARSAEQDRALHLLSPQDRAAFDQIRERAPHHLSDETVAQAMLEAKRAGLDGAERIAGVAMVGDKMHVYGTTPGFVASIDVTAAAQRLQLTAEQAGEFDRQRETRIAMEHKPLESDAPERSGPAR
ncbi:hypothetical protein J5226_08010 [Lysobacter sp. K5869]|uniref:XVIPCD domain-containing protein n=1 Tax=Lysobacter sp. K5869 TaxID=2820808 RepID=UPI001C05F72C|nr:XVIPCD domain-containing protein [Lysobacter sp. K5869]QWP78324.1 hypothetical protein J5226_08010 [Lysobacter sp. K5869]